MIEAGRGLLRILSAYEPRRLIEALRSFGATPVALLAATAASDPHRIAWRDAAGEMSYADVVARIESRRGGTGPLLATESDPRLLVLTVLAALADRRGVAVLGARGGTVAAQVPVGPGLAFLSSGTTGRPRAHVTRRRPLALLPYLGMVGRLPYLRRPLVGSPSHPDHGHAFLLVLLTWALGGTYVQIDASVGHLDVLSGVPRQLADVLDNGWCTGATHVVSGSDRLDPALATRLASSLGASVWDAYGATETGPISLASPADVRAGTVGRPLPGVRVRVGDDGRLSVRTPVGGEVFRGDRGRIDAAGRLVLEGRADGRLVTGGEVVDPDLLRRWLESQPGILRAEVITVPDDRFGERLAVTVVGAVVDVNAVRTAIRHDLGPAHVPVSLTVTPVVPPEG